MRFAYGYEEHTPENTISSGGCRQISRSKYRLFRLIMEQNLHISYQYISEEKLCRFDVLLNKQNIPLTTQLSSRFLRKIFLTNDTSRTIMISVEWLGRLAQLARASA